jgi:hypothetical protein
MENYSYWNTKIRDAPDIETLDALFKTMDSDEQELWLDTIEDKKAKLMGE